MCDNHRWMYDSWNKSGAHSYEWYDKTKDFIECALSLSTIDKIKCPCDRCQTVKLFDKIIVTKYLCRNGFTSHYEIWVFHDKKYATVAAKGEVNDRASTDRMDEMLEAIEAMFNLNIGDPLTRG
jgi:hypothetical protein